GIVFHKANGRVSEPTREELFGTQGCADLRYFRKRQQKPRGIHVHAGKVGPEPGVSIRRKSRRKNLHSERGDGKCGLTPVTQWFSSVALFPACLLPPPYRCRPLSRR